MLFKYIKGWWFIILILLIIAGAGVGLLFYPAEKTSPDKTLLNLFDKNKFEFQLEIRNYNEDFKHLINNIEPVVRENIPEFDYMKLKNNLLIAAPLLERTVFYQTAAGVPADGSGFLIVSRMSNLSVFLGWIAEAVFHNNIILAEKTGLGIDLYYKISGRFFFLSNRISFIDNVEAARKRVSYSKGKFNDGLYCRIFLNERLRKQLSDARKKSFTSFNSFEQNISNRKNRIDISGTASLSDKALEYIREVDSKNYPSKVDSLREIDIKDDKAQIKINVNSRIKILWDIFCRKIFGEKMRPSASRSTPEAVILWNFFNNAIARQARGNFCLTVGKWIENKDTLPFPFVALAAPFKDRKEAIKVINYEVGNFIDYHKSKTGNPAWDAITGDTEYSTTNRGGELKLNRLFFNGIEPEWEFVEESQGILGFISHKDIENNFLQSIAIGEKEVNPSPGNFLVAWNIDHEQAEKWQELILEKAVSYNWLGKSYHNTIRQLTESMKKIMHNIPKGNSQVIINSDKGNVSYSAELSLK